MFDVWCLMFDVDIGIEWYRYVLYRYNVDNYRERTMYINKYKSAFTSFI